MLLWCREGIKIAHTHAQSCVFFEKHIAGLDIKCLIFWKIYRISLWHGVSKVKDVFLHLEITIQHFKVRKKNKDILFFDILIFFISVVPILYANLS